MKTKKSVITNNKELKFSNLTDEQYRTYTFPTNQVRIEGPIALHVSKSGGHRILDSQGNSHYIPTGWTQLTWKVKEGQPYFAF